MKVTRLLFFVLVITTGNATYGQNISFSELKSLATVERNFNETSNYLMDRGFYFKKNISKEKANGYSFKAFSLSCTWKDDEYDYKYYNYVDYLVSNSGSTRIAIFITSCTHQYKAIMKEITTKGFNELSSEYENGSNTIKYQSNNHPGLKIITSIKDNETAGVVDYKIFFAYEN